MSLNRPTPDAPFRHFDGGSSDKVDAIIQQITNRGVKWHTYDISQESAQLTLQGANEDGLLCKVEVTSVSCGFTGTGPANAVRLLVGLGFGEQKTLTEEVTAKDNVHGTMPSK